MSLENFGQDLNAAMQHVTKRGHWIEHGGAIGGGLGVYAYAKHKKKKHPVLESKLGMLPTEIGIPAAALYAMKHRDSQIAKAIMDF